MAETHPILEAVARAAERAYVETRIAALRKSRDHIHQADVEPAAWRAGALAAARVILSAEPSEGQRRAVYDTDAIRASNAALLREIEGGNG